MSAPETRCGLILSNQQSTNRECKFHNYCCPVKLKIAQDLSPNSFIIKDSDFFMIKASPP